MQMQQTLFESPMSSLAVQLQTRAGLSTELWLRHPTGREIDAAALSLDTQPILPPTAQRQTFNM